MFIFWTLVTRKKNVETNRKYLDKTHFYRKICFNSHSNTRTLWFGEYIDTVAVRMLKSNEKFKEEKKKPQTLAKVFILKVKLWISLRKHVRKISVFYLYDQQNFSFSDRLPKKNCNNLWTMKKSKQESSNK